MKIKSLGLASLIEIKRDEEIVFISSKHISDLNYERFFHEVKILVHKDKQIFKGLKRLIQNTIKTYKRTGDS